MPQGWRFSKQVPGGFEQLQFDDSGFEPICLPHTNLKLPWHSFDEKSYQFVSAYRQRFRLPPDAKGKNVFVDFEGVMTPQRPCGSTASAFANTEADTLRSVST
jgi:beta-galactosidase